LDHQDNYIKRLNVDDKMQQKIYHSSKSIIILMVQTKVFSYLY